MDKKMAKKVLLGTLVAGSAVALTACGEVEKGYTYNTYTSTSPSNWNELTYQDSNDTQIMNYLSTDLFEYDFAFDSNGDIIEGDYEVKFGAASALKDVSSESSKKDGTVWEITLRKDLEWSDGTEIDAHDFVYSMEQLLDPAFLNYRANSYYDGATSIVGAYAYAKAGSTEYSFSTEISWAETSKDTDGDYTLNSKKIVIGLFQGLNVLDGGYDLDEEVYYYLDEDADSMAAMAVLEDAADADGYLYVNDTTLEAVKVLAAALSEVYGETVTATDLMGIEVGVYASDVTFADTVQFEATGDYTLRFELENACNLLNTDGSLSYLAAYNMASLPLVHEELYEANKVAPVTGSTLWTSTYNSSVETTASWGPYTLSSFQSGKEYVLSKNYDWFGFNDKENKDLYLTEKIVCETISEWSTAWLKFQKGEIDTIGIDVTISDDYKGSERAYYTPSSFIASLQIQSSEEAIKSYTESNTSGNNTQLLLYPEFREALSLAVDRTAFASQTTTSSLAGYGLFNTMHYHDVANGQTYRSTDAAKKALIDTYGIDVNDFGGDLTLAEASITGYDVEEASRLMQSAYDKALADGNFSATDKINLRVSISTISASVTRQLEFLDAAMKKAAEGTSLENRIEVSYIENTSAWATAFRSGSGELCLGGWSGAAWDPGYFLSAYLGDVRYATGWDTTSEMMTYTMELPNNKSVTETASLWTWYQWLNGAANAPAGKDGEVYDWSSASLDQTYRVELIAEIEKAILKSTYVAPLYNSFSASLISYKIDYVTYTYNTFMSYGGIKYMTYNFNNTDWAAVAGDADYKG